MSDRLETAALQLTSLGLFVDAEANLQVVARDIFATPNSLKSHETRKVKSPFSNIRAVTSKLCLDSMPAAVQNRPA